MTDPADLQPHDAFHESIGHVVPLRTLAGVFALLMVLTAITVMATWFDAGSPQVNVLIAVAIATVKAILVGLYFMHLRWDSPLNSAILIISLIFLGLLLIFVLWDSFNYAGNLMPTDAARISPG